MSQTAPSAWAQACTEPKSFWKAIAPIIEPVLAWNFEAVPDRFDDLAHAVGLGDDGAAFVPWLARLKAQIGISGGLAARGVTSEHLPRLVALAATDFAGVTNPRPAAEADYQRLFLQAM